MLFPFLSFPNISKDGVNYFNMLVTLER